MSKIIFNDIAYGEFGSMGGGGLGGGVIELTQAEYDNLTIEEKEDDVLYLITDGTPDKIIVNDPAPIGSIQAYGGSTAPDGWLFCQGQAISRLLYSELFAVIGTLYGEGDGATTFNLPDLRGRVTIGQSTTYELGASGGEATHTLSINEIPSHTHNVTAGFTMRGTDYNDSAMLWGGTGTTVAKTTGTNNQVDTVHQVNGAQQTWALTLNRDTTSKGGDAAHNNMQPYLVTNYIIKAKENDFSNSRILPMLDFFYPVGSYYETSDTNFNPNEIWGGTWISTNLLSQDSYITKDVFSSNVTTSPTTYIATDSGLLVLVLVSSSRVYCSITINEVYYADFAYPPGTGGTFVGPPIVVPVKKNDVVKFNNLSENCSIMAARTKLYAYEVIGKKWCRTA